MKKLIAMSLAATLLVGAYVIFSQYDARRLGQQAETYTDGDHHQASSVADDKQRPGEENPLKQAMNNSAMRSPPDSVNAQSRVTDDESDPAPSAQVNVDATRLSQDESALVTGSERNAATEADVALEEATDNPLLPGNIGGRVLDNNGFALPASVVTARPVDVNQVVQPYEIMADSDGWFTFSSLPGGDYHLLATDTVSGNSSQTVRVSTGTDIVDLVVPVVQTLVLYGAVTEIGGDPVPAASIRLLPAGVSTSTDDLGVYLMEVEIKRETGQLLVVEKQGYEPVKRPVSQQQWKASPELQVDVRLQPDAETTTVSGTVVDDRGNPVSGQNMQLNNSSYRYSTRTDQLGIFRFNEVSVGSNYHLNVLTDIAYERHQQSGLRVPSDGISNLQITVRKRGSGEVSGSFVSASGEQLSGYSSNVIITGHRIPITSGSDGKFRVADVPAGSISIGNSGLATVTTSGVKLEDDESVTIVVVVDVGVQQFVGTVVDESGQPVGGAKILWRWQSRQDGLLHESMRNAVSDSNGRFALTGFAAVPHELRILAAGYAPLQTTVPASQSSGEYTLR